MVGYNRYKDTSYYCWMTGVAPQGRKRGILIKMMKQFEVEAKSRGSLLLYETK
jgi:hypothetical protein